jgi:hypothetical protein
LPALSTATLDGVRIALVAGPPSASANVPPPATVVMIPLAETFRTRKLFVSAMNRLPAPSTATLHGHSCALVAGPPSPEKPRVPLPATVVMIPSGETRRIQ